MLTDKRTKNGQMNRRSNTNFKSNLAMMVIYLPVKFEFDWTKYFQEESRNRNVDGQTKNGQPVKITPISKAI